VSTFAIPLQLKKEQPKKQPAFLYSGHFLDLKVAIWLVLLFRLH